MRELLVILRTLRGSFRGSLPLRLATVVAMAALAGSAAGSVPGVVGAAMDSVLGRSAPRSAGIGGTFGRMLQGAPIAVVLCATLVVVAASVAVTVLSSAAASRLSGELTAALRIRLLEVVLGASPRAVDDAGRAIAEGKSSGPAPPAPPGVKAPSV